MKQTLKQIIFFGILAMVSVGIVQTVRNAYEEKQNAQNNSYLALFYREDCPVCEIIMSEMKEIAKTEPIELIETRTEKGTQLKEKYQIDRVPTLLYEKNGEIIIKENPLMKKDDEWVLNKTLIHETIKKYKAK